MIFFRHFRKYLVSFLNKTGFIFLIFSIFILINSSSYQRFLNIYDDIYSVDSKNTHHWTQQDSIIPRLIIWDGSIEIIKDNYLVGVGLDNFNKSLDEQIRLNNIQPVRKDLNNPTAGLNHAHNQYLDIFAKAGIFGLAALIIFIYINYYFFVYHIRKSDDNLYSIFGLLVIISYSIFMLNHAVLSHHQSTIFMLLMLIFCAAQSKTTTTETVL